MDAGTQLKTAFKNGILKPCSIESFSLKRSLLIEVDPGEAEAICVAMERETDGLLIDEKAGRQAARRIGICCTGTVGILLRAKNTGHIPSLRKSLNTLVADYAFALHPSLIEDACKSVGE